MNTNTKVILTILVLLIAGLSSYMFVIKPEPVELTEDGTADKLHQRNQPGTEQQTDLAAQQTPNPETGSSLEGLQVTPLDLILLGVVASDNVNEASATINSNQQIRTYFINDQIAYTNATLLEVRNDRAILLNAGQKQVLLLQGTRVTEDLAARSNVQTSQQERNTGGTGLTAEEIGNRPSALEHIVTTAPFYDNGTQTGWLVSPGINPKLFGSAKFKEGDVLQKINGLDLTDPQQLTQAKKMIQTVDTLVFSVLRGGRVISLYLDIPAKGLQISN